MKKLFAPALLLASLAACSEVAPTGPDTGSAMFNNGVSSPNTVINGTVTVYVAGSITYRESGPGNNGKGACTTGGAWYNPATKKTSEKQHPQCATIVPGYSMTVPVALEAANHVQPRSGNEHLNWAPVVETGASRQLTFSKNSGMTTGTGVIFGTESGAATAAWSIDLGQTMLQQTGNLIADRSLMLQACHATHGCHPATLAW